LNSIHLICDSYFNFINIEIGKLQIRCTYTVQMTDAVYTVFFMITTSIPILLVKFLNFFLFYWFHHFFHVRVHGQCPATAKHNLMCTLKTVHKLLQSYCFAVSLQGLIQNIKLGGKVNHFGFRGSGGMPPPPPRNFFGNLDINIPNFSKIYYDAIVY